MGQYICLFPGCGDISKQYNGISVIWVSFHARFAVVHWCFVICPPTTCVDQRWFAGEENYFLSDISHFMRPVILLVRHIDVKCVLFTI